MSQPNNPMVYRIPHRINEETVFLIVFTKTEIMPSLVALAVGMLMGKAMYFLLGGIIYTHLMRKLGKRLRPGDIRHWLWRKGLFPFGESSGFPDPMNREFYR